MPPPDGHTRWDQDAVDEVLSDMLDRAGQSVIVSCFIQATDPGSLERLFFASIRNFLIDEAKMTDRGKLRRRIASRMEKDPGFKPVRIATSPGWALASHPDRTVWQGDLDELIEAAYRVRDVQVVRWNTSGPTPAATEHALMTVLAAVLKAAQGAVREEDLAKVLEARFALLQPLTSVALFAEDGEATADPAAAHTLELDLAQVDARAQRIWDSLTPLQRAVLARLDQPAKGAAAVLGVGPTQARAIMDGLKEALRLALADDAAMEEVMSALLQRAAPPPS